MSLKDLPLTELLKLAAVEADSDKLKHLIREISERYGEQERHMVFDIFFGVQDRDAVWKESVVGLHAANERMHRMAADVPGSYFVFHSQSQRVMARLDNGPIRASSEVKPPKTATA